MSVTTFISTDQPQTVTLLVSFLLSMVISIATDGARVILKSVSDRSCDTSISFADRLGKENHKKN